MLGLVGVSMFAVAARGSYVAAQEAEQSENADEVESAPTEDEQSSESDAAFEYTAEECDTLTHMVRQSLILFDEANDDVSLSHEQIIYAETNAVAEIGPRYLDIGEMVSIDSNVIEKFAKSSQGLSADQIAAWTPYTSNVNFSLASVKPDNDISEAVKPADVREGEAETAAGNANGNSDDSLSGGLNTSEVSPAWWVAGAGSVVGLWYLLYRKKEDGELS